MCSEKLLEKRVTQQQDRSLWLAHYKGKQCFLLATLFSVTAPSGRTHTWPGCLVTYALARLSLLQTPLLASAHIARAWPGSCLLLHWAPLSCMIYEVCPILSNIKPSVFSSCLHIVQLSSGIYVQEDSRRFFLMSLSSLLCVLSSAQILKHPANSRIYDLMSTSLACVAYMQPYLAEAHLFQPCQNQQSAPYWVITGVKLTGALRSNVHYFDFRV